MIVSEMRWIRLLKHFKFLTHFIGLGLFYIFVGGLALGSAWYELGLGISLIILGSVYSMLGCCGLSMKNQELPKFMQRQQPSELNDISIQQPVQPVKSVYVPPTHKTALIEHNTTLQSSASPDPEYVSNNTIIANTLPSHNPNTIKTVNKYDTTYSENPFE